MNRSFRKSCLTLCRLLLGVMVFAQVANASLTCVVPNMSAVMAFAHSGQDDHCHKNVNPNSCLQQATAKDQSSGQAEALTFASSNVAVLVLPRQFDPVLP